MEWKLISKEKPEEGQNCIICSEHGNLHRMVTAVWKNDKFLAYNWFTEELEEAEDFTHWMPQPKLPSALA